jgi:hypothetical protein
MGGDAFGRRIIGVAMATALSATACAGALPPARNPTSGDARGDGVTDAQPDATGASPAPAPPPEAPAAATSSTGDDYGSDPGRDPHRTRRDLGLAFLSIGGEAAIVAIITSAMLEHQMGIRDEGCNAQKVCDTAGIDAVHTISTIVPWNTATWFVAAAGLGIGTVLVVISLPHSERRTAITLSPNESGLGLGLRSSF